MKSQLGKDKKVYIAVAIMGFTTSIITGNMLELLGSAAEANPLWGFIYSVLPNKWAFWMVSIPIKQLVFLTFFYRLEELIVKGALLFAVLISVINDSLIAVCSILQKTPPQVFILSGAILTATIITGKWLHGRYVKNDSEGAET